MIILVFVISNLLIHLFIGVVVGVCTKVHKWRSEDMQKLLLSLCTLTEADPGSLTLVIRPLSTIFLPNELSHELKSDFL